MRVLRRSMDRRTVQLLGERFEGELVGQGDRFRTFEEMVGRADRLEVRRAVNHWKAKGLDYAAILYQPKVPPDVGRYCQIPQNHGLENALDNQVLGAALGKFSDTSRRFEVKGEKNGITVVDDYAHHPSEIRATLAAARARYPDHRIVAVWQPHTYSRTRALFTEFAAAFDDADEAIVTEIYAAREPLEEARVEQRLHPAVDLLGHFHHQGALHLAVRRQRDRHPQLLAALHGDDAAGPPIALPRQLQDVLPLLHLQRLRRPWLARPAVDEWAGGRGRSDDLTALILKAR